MPVKWKIYYACSLYNLLCYLGIIGLLVYGLIKDHNSPTDIVEMCLVVCAFIIASFKCLLSLKFVGYFLSKKMFSKTERVFYIIGYCVNALILVLVAVIIFSIVRNIFFSRYPYHPDPLQLIIYIGVGMLVFTICTNIIFDFPLSKAIRKQDNFDIATIGSHIHDNP